MTARRVRRHVLCLVACIGLQVVLSSCGGRGNAGGIFVPLAKSGVALPDYVLQLEAAPSSPEELQLLWLDESKGSNRIWTATIRKERVQGRYEVVGPRLLDRGNIRFCALAAGFGQVAVLYCKNSQLILIAPTAAAPRALTDATQQSPLSSGVVIKANGDLLVLALVMQLHELQPFTHDILAYQIRSSRAAQSEVVRVSVPPGRVRQPAPYMAVTGDTLVGTFYLRGARLAAAPDTPADSVPLGQRSGQLVVLRAVGTSEDSLTLALVTAETLPTDRDLAEATSFAMLDLPSRAIVAGTPRQRVVRLGGASPILQDLASPSGSGSVYGASTLASLRLSDSSTLVSWIDTERQARDLEPGEGAEDPTIMGGDVELALLNPALSGRLVGRRLATLRTRAEAIALTAFEGRPWLARIDAERPTGASARPTRLELQPVQVAP